MFTNFHFYKMDFWIHLASNDRQEMAAIKLLLFRKKDVMYSIYINANAHAYVWLIVVLYILIILL